MNVFETREDAGKKLAQKLSSYKGKDVVVYALPRGGVVVGVTVAKLLKASIDLVISRKIGHPMQEEYAIAAVSEHGDVVGEGKELAAIDQDWLVDAIKQEQYEAKRRRAHYGGNLPKISSEGKIAIIVDDGIATGLTAKAAIKDLQRKFPKKIVVAAPVISSEAAKELKMLVDDVVFLKKPKDFTSIGGYYKEFPQVSDEEVISLLKAFKKVN